MRERADLRLGRAGTHVGVHRLAPAALRHGDALDICQRLHILVGQAEGRLHADIKEMLRVKVLVGRAAQVLARGAQAHEHRGAEHADDRERHKALERAAHRAGGPQVKGLVGGLSRHTLPLDLRDGQRVLVHRHLGHPSAFEANQPVCHGGQRRVVRDDHDGDAVAAAGVLE